MRLACFHLLRSLPLARLHRLPARSALPPAMHPSTEDHRRLFFLGPRLPPTPESPAEPTFLPHVREPLPSLLAANGDAAPPRSKLSLTSDASSPAGIGLNLLLHSRDALANLHHLYTTSAAAQQALTAATNTIVNSVRHGGRLIVSGVGKSGKVGEKIVATCNSLQVRAAWMHATEAVHGDMGMLGPVRSLWGDEARS